VRARRCARRDAHRRCAGSRRQCREPAPRLATRSGRCRGRDQAGGAGGRLPGRQAAPELPIMAWGHRERGGRGRVPPRGSLGGPGGHRHARGSGRPGAGRPGDPGLPEGKGIASPADLRGGYASDARPPPRASRDPSPAEPIVVALDVSDLERAEALTRTLEGEVGLFKSGSSCSRPSAPRRSTGYASAAGLPGSQAPRHPQYGRARRSELRSLGPRS